MILLREIMKISSLIIQGSGARVKSSGAKVVLFFILLVKGKGSGRSRDIL